MARTFLSLIRGESGKAPETPVNDPVSAQLTALADRVSALTLENTDLKAQIQAAVDNGEAFAALETEVAGLRTQLAAKDGEISAAVTRAADAEQARAALEAEIPGKVNAGVIEAMAAQGVPGSQVPEYAPPNAQKLRISAAEFKALSPREQSAFSIAGGRIIA